MATHTDPASSSSTHEPEPESALWRADRVCRYTTLNRSTLWRQVRAGKFPAPIKLSDYRIAWRSADVMAWVQNRPTHYVREPAQFVESRARVKARARRRRPTEP
jgi:prophage regulatory protein